MVDESICGVTIAVARVTQEIIVGRFMEGQQTGHQSNNPMAEDFRCKFCQ